jgi:putative spermidine/putrescine transport system ATP-binding protein
MPSAIALRSVTRHHAGAPRPAVDGVTLDAAPGELLAIVGASGSGKTTTLRMAAGYEMPDAGAVLRDGADVTRLPPERRGFGMVFQHHALFPHLSVEENVAFGLEARGVGRAERRARAREALAGVGLAGTGGRAVRELSGGEQQRVAIARALVIEPGVLLLDEPLSNLDPALRIAMRDELRALLRRREVTALLVTHDQEDAFAVADRVALLHAGRVLQVGAPETLYDRPASRAVAAFIGLATLVPAHVADGVATLVVGGVAQRARALSATGAPLAAPLAVVRPEQLALARAGQDDETGWSGRVAARRFAGGRTICRVALAEGPDVQVEVRARDVREGDVVRVRLAADALAVVSADDRDADEDREIARSAPAPSPRPGPGRRLAAP